MKLWVLLDEKIDVASFRSEDLILATPASAEMLSSLNCRQVITNFSACDEQPYASDIVNEIFNSMPDKFWIYKNKFYMSIARPLCAVIFQIHSILEDNDINELILVGGSEYPFMSCFRTNGEGVRMWFKTSWLMNSVIASYVKENYGGITLSWLKKGVSCFSHIKNVIRENQYLCKTALLELRRRLLIRDKNIMSENERKSIKSVAIAQLDLQLNHLSLALGKTESTNAIVVSNKTGINSVTDQRIIRALPNTFMDIVRLYFQTKIKPRHNDICISIAGAEIIISNRDIIRSLYHEILLMKFTEKSFIDVLETLPNIDTLYTDGTFGTDMVLWYRYASTRGIKHINYQYVLMNKMLFPIVELADEYYIFARKTYELYHKLSDSYKFYMPIYREPLRGNKDNITISIFLQPDDYTIRYFKLLKEIIPLFDNISCIKEVSIKPHYRQIEIKEIEEMVKTGKKMKLCPKDHSATDIIKQSDIMMSISSSVLFEALSYGTPGIIMDVDKQERNIIFSNDSFGKEVNFYVDSIEAIALLVEDYESTFDKYLKRRETYLSQIREGL